MAADGTPQPSARLTLRPFAVQDERAALSAHALLLREGFSFLLDYDPDTGWADYLVRLDEISNGVNLGWGRVPSTLLVADVSGTMVGRTSIRHELNSFLIHEGGHIGYAVIPDERRKGYATAILLRSLERARELGIGTALVTCDDDNTGSATVIERCGGILESVVRASTGRSVRRYWLDTGG
jgi:predicted acetyltransferase